MSLFGYVTAEVEKHAICVVGSFNLFEAAGITRIMLSSNNLNFTLRNLTYSST